MTSSGSKNFSGERLSNEQSAGASQKSGLSPQIPADTVEKLRAEVEELRFRLQEAEETLQTIREGGVDALVVSTPEGMQVYTLEGADQPYRILMETMNEGAATLSPDGTILYCNGRLAEMLQVSLEKLIGSNIGDHVAQRHQAVFGERLVQCTDYAAKDEISMTDAAGNSLPVLISCRSIDFRGSAAINMVFTDLSDMKKLEEQLLHAQKMESIGLFAGGVAHDFNNLLSCIYGNGEIIQENIPEGHDVLQDSIEQVLRAAERAGELTKSLLTFSRKEAMHLEPVQIGRIINATGKLIERIIGEDIEFRTEMQQSDLQVLADPGQIEQVLMNLATNARDAMPHGGRLTVSCRRFLVKPGAEILYDVPKAGKYALMSIVDTGAGIEKESLCRLFEPFFTTKEVGKGTGLGLSIVYGIVKEHNGAVLISSEPGKGTKVDILLPLLEKAPRAKAAKAPVSPSGGTETIILAEDEEIVRVLLQRLLQKAGYNVIAVGNGEEALTKISELNDVSLVLSDVVMPKKNGGELFQEMKSLNPGVKLILISGYTADIMNAKGLKEEAIDFISKPVSKADLLRKIREVLDRE